MHKRLEAAVRDHLGEDADVTGFLLVTFHDGRAVITGGSDGADETAEVWIAGLTEALTTPIVEAYASDDPIGHCLGAA